MNVLFVVNGDWASAAAERSRRIAAAWAGGSAAIVYRVGPRAMDVVRAAHAAGRPRPDVLYAMDLAVVPVAAAMARPGVPLVVDTGDAPADFFALINAPWPTRLAARTLELVGYRRASVIIVRGPHHRHDLEARGYAPVEVIPDGVDLELFRPVEDAALRRSMGLDGVFTVGIQGHFTWYDRLGGGLGWELVEAMALCPDLQVHGVLIGSGPGLGRLLELAHRRGVADRIHLLGKVPLTELSRCLGLCDVCLLTQTNDPSSWARTTGKLPGYLACGRYVVASRVGTVAELLPQEMLLAYEGRWDRDYPGRLADRIREIAADPDRRQKGLALRALATPFDYDVVARRAATVIDAVGSTTKVVRCAA